MMSQNQNDQSPNTNKNPRGGFYCPKCDVIVPRFHDFSDDDLAKLHRLVDEARTVLAIDYLRQRTRTEIHEAKIWIRHIEGPCEKGYRGNAKCPKCGARLRTPQAKQCPECFQRWVE